MRAITVAKPVLLVATLIPATLLAVGTFTIAPVAFYPRYVINNTGDWGLRLLVMSLFVTPVRRLTGWNDVIRLRRTLGVAAFFYSAAHLVLWASLEWSFQFRPMLERIVTDPFISVGTVAFALLVPLAATSNRAGMSMLGRHWRKLHWITYIATVLALAHFWLEGPFGALAVPKWIAIVVALLGFRLWVIGKRVIGGGPLRAES